MISLLPRTTELSTLVPSDGEEQMLEHHAGVEVCGNSTLYHLQRDKGQPKHKSSYERQ